MVWKQIYDFSMSVVDFVWYLCCPVAWVVVRTRWLTPHHMGTVFCDLVFHSFFEMLHKCLLQHWSWAVLGVLKHLPFVRKKILFFLSWESLFLGWYWKSDRTFLPVPRWQSSPNSFKVFENLNNCHIVKNSQDMFLKPFCSLVRHDLSLWKMCFFRLL